MSLNVRQLTLNIGNTLVCENLDIQCNPGEFWAVLGVNGVGKSTLLHRLIDVTGSDAKIIQIDDQPLTEFRRHRKQLARCVGLLLQDYEYHFPCTVMEATLIGRHPYTSEWQWQRKKDMDIALNALRQTEIYHLKDRLLDTLSGGEKRRLNIATLLTQDPRYLLLDEPTNHLDLAAQIKMLTLIRQTIVQNSKTGIMVIHDANLANRFCDKVLMLFGNGDWLSGSTEKLLNIQNLERLYGCQFQLLVNGTQSFFAPS